MDNNQPVPPHIPTEAEMTEQVVIMLTPEEKEMLSSISSIFAQLNLQNNIPVLKENNFSELLRMCVGFTISTYQSQVFLDSNIVSRLTTKKAVKEFIAYRKKYMKIPVDAQLADLKRLGYVKGKE